MRRRLFLLPLLVVLGGCTLGGADDPPAGTDPQIVVPELGGVVWQRQVGTLTVLGLTANVDLAELTLLEAALADVPEPIAARAKIRNLVRAADAEVLDPATLAFSRGPDIYLLDKTFEDATRLDLAYTVVHELAHVAQFNTLDPDYAEQVVAGKIEALDTNRASLDVQDFIEAIGWEDQGGDAWFSSSAAAGTTVYGATGPSEDMAESVALVATGRSNELSAERVSWVEEWVGVSAAEMAGGKPWRPPDATIIESADAIYDAGRVGALPGSHAEPLYLLLVDDGSTLGAIAARVTEELRSRQMTGVLAEVADPAVPRLGGSMVRADGSRLWVELWDFRGAGVGGGPPGVVLTYVDVWS